MERRRHVFGIITAAVCGALLISGEAQADGHIATRRARQQARIAQGVRSGQLTPRETARLERHEARLNREIRGMRQRNGGKLTPGERRRINRRQNRLSREIDREKHDREHR